MHRFCIAAIAALVATSAHGAKLIPVPGVPGATNTYVFDINDHNVIAGGYVTNGVEHAFFGTLDGNYQTFDYEPTGGTEARAIDNSGNITGISHFASGYKYCQYLEYERAADGNIAAIEIGQTPLNGIAQGFTGNGKFVGDYCHRHKVDGYDGRSGKYKGPIAIAVSTPATYPRDINSSGEVDGDFINSAGTDSSFLLKNGVTSVIDYPNAGATDTVLQGLNDSGIATGHWDKGVFLWHAFALDTNTNTFTSITVPGHPAYVQAFGINKAGLVAIDASTGPYIYCPSGATCPTGGVKVAVHRTRVSPGAFLHFDVSHTGRHASRVATPHPGQVNADGVH